MIFTSIHYFSTYITRAKSLQISQGFYAFTVHHIKKIVNQHILGESNKNYP